MFNDLGNRDRGRAGDAGGQAGGREQRSREQGAGSRERMREFMSGLLMVLFILRPPCEGRLYNMHRVPRKLTRGGLAAILLGSD